MESGKDSAKPQGPPLIAAGVAVTNQYAIICTCPKSVTSSENDDVRRTIMVGWNLVSIIAKVGLVSSPLASNTAASDHYRERMGLSFRQGQLNDRRFRC
jgi:hypothetical protein